MKTKNQETMQHAGSREGFPAFSADPGKHVCTWNRRNIYRTGRIMDAGKESIPAGEQTRFGETGGKQNMEDCF